MFLHFEIICHPKNWSTSNRKWTRADLYHISEGFCQASFSGS